MKGEMEKDRLTYDPTCVGTWLYQIIKMSEIQDKL